MARLLPLLTKEVLWGSAVVVLLLLTADDSLDKVPTDPDCRRVNFARSFALRSGIGDGRRRRRATQAREQRSRGPTSAVVGDAGADLQLHRSGDRKDGGAVDAGAAAGFRFCDAHRCHVKGESKRRSRRRSEVGGRRSMRRVARSKASAIGDD